MLYHAGIGPFSGGYVGVDVFFVVSGFLITSLLLAEVGEHGSVHLPSFWARRARRLLPASMLVVAVTLLFTRLWFDPLLVGDVERDALAAAGFSGNMVFAYRAARGGAGYFDADLAASPLLHFWSLAVEEQFYLVWPLVIWFLARRARRLRSDLGLVIAVVWVASLLACVVVTEHSQPWAFYSLPTRAWELATGAAIAVALPSLTRLRRALASLLTLAGIVGIVVIAVTYDDRTRFPGLAALGPVLATAAIVVGSSRRGSATGIVQLLGSRPMLWIGQRSYAIYLWHWPVLILAGVHWGPLPVGGRLLAVAVAVGLAALSFAFVEDPLRHAAFLRAPAVRSLAFGAALLAVGALIAGVLLLQPPKTSGGGAAAAVTLPAADPNDIAAAATTVPAPTPLVGVPVPTDAVATTSTSVTTTTVPAVPMDPLVAAGQAILEAGLQVTEVPSNLDPSLADVRGDQPKVFDDGCLLDWGDSEPRTCVYGDPGASRVIAVLGDSHAAQWYAALQKIALTHDYRLLYFAKLGCPPSTQPLLNGVTGDCDAWRDKAIAQIIASNPRLIILTGYHYDAADGTNGDGLWREGMAETMTALGEDASRVLILGDTPTQYVDVAQCLANHLKSVPACNSTRDYAVREGRLAIEQEIAAQFAAHAADTSDWLCTPVACPVIVGNTLLYRDRNHITNAAAELLWPLLDQVVQPLMQR